MSYNIIRKEFNYEIYFLHREKNDIMIIWRCFSAFKLGLK
jgi:hypothetical protein